MTAIIFSMAAIICVAVAGESYKYKYHSVETISVTGLAGTDFTADLIVWSGSYNRKNMDLKAAYADLKNDETKIRTYLKQKGVDEKEIVFSSVSINKDYDYKYDNYGNQTGNTFNGYNLSQTVTVQSKRVEQIEKISREVTELIENGIEFYSNAPSYYYTKLGELKVDLLAQAATDAHNRAKTIADNSGNTLGSLSKASMGVFQITGQNSNDDYSYGGAYNTSSKNKTASITIKTEYHTH